MAEDGRINRNFGVPKWVNRVPPPTKPRSGWWLMLLFMWDAIFHRKLDPHMQRAMDLSNEQYRGKMWD